MDLHGCSTARCARSTPGPLPLGTHRWHLVSEKGGGTQSTVNRTCGLRSHAHEMDACEVRLHAAGSAAACCPLNCTSGARLIDIVTCDEGAFCCSGPRGVPDFGRAGYRDHTRDAAAGWHHYPGYAQRQRRGDAGPWLRRGGRLLTGALVGALLCRSARCLPFTAHCLPYGWRAQLMRALGGWCSQDPESEFGAASNDDLIGKNMAMRLQKQEVCECASARGDPPTLGCWSVVES